MNAIHAAHVSYRYGRVHALADLELRVPTGSVYALLGPNGAGKTTLLQLLIGARRRQAGEMQLLGKDIAHLALADRALIGYVAEGQSLPAWMRIEQMKAFLAPLYPTWDAALAANLRDRFNLDPKRRVGTLSRGEYMKAALLCALAPRPRLLMMDEPFTGVDAAVRDELVRGVLESAGSEGWTVLVSSHDLAELEMLADWVGFLDAGKMLLSESMESLHQRFRKVSVVLDRAASEGPKLPADWMSVERAGPHVSFLVSAPSHDDDALRRAVAPTFPNATRIESREATLREVFIGLARRKSQRAIDNGREAIV